MWPNKTVEIATYTYDPEKDQLEGWVKFPPDTTTYGLIALSRDRSFTVYKDYTQYLAGQRITAKTYQDTTLEHYGKGYLVYLPEGCEDHSDQFDLQSC